METKEEEKKNTDVEDNNLHSNYSAEWIELSNGNAILVEIKFYRV